MPAPRDDAGAAATTDLGIVTLLKDKLYALPQPVALDGRLGTHPLASRGFAPFNLYLAVEGDHALLLDTGYSAHEQLICTQLASLLRPSMTLSIFALRLGEYASICNVRPIVERFNVDILYGSQGKPPIWVDFRPEYVPYGSDIGQGALSQIEGRVARKGDMIPVGPGGRVVAALDAPLRLLPTNWMYDEPSRTLFTADAFTYATRPTEAGPWLATIDDDPTTIESAWEHLLGARYWWLPGARTEFIRGGMAAIFDTYEIDVIAPSYGCILAGADMVARHYQLLDDILADAPARPSIGLEVGQWKLAAGSAA